MWLTGGYYNRFSPMLYNLAIEYCFCISTHQDLPQQRLTRNALEMLHCDNHFPKGYYTRFSPMPHLAIEYCFCISTHQDRGSMSLLLPQQRLARHGLEMVKKFIVWQPLTREVTAPDFLQCFHLADEHYCFCTSTHQESRSMSQYFFSRNDNDSLEMY